MGSDGFLGRLTKTGGTVYLEEISTLELKVAKGTILASAEGWPSYVTNYFRNVTFPMTIGEYEQEGLINGEVVDINNFTVTQDVTVIVFNDD